MRIGNRSAMFQGIGMVGLLGLCACGGGGAKDEPAAQSPTPPISVVVSPGTPEVVVGYAQAFTATTQGATDTHFVWEVDGVVNGSSTLGTITGTGSQAVYTAPATPGDHALTATSAADPSRRGTTTVRVKNRTISVGLTPGASTLNGGGTLAFTASVTGTTNSAVTWSVDGVVGGNTSVGTLTGTGTTATYRAPTAAGTHVVTAKSVEDASKSASSVVTVEAVPPPPPAVVSVALSPSSTSLAATATHAFTATVSGSTNTSVTWFVDGVANGSSTTGTVSGTGNTITYNAPSAGGNHTLVAKSSADPTKSASAAITVAPPPPPVVISVTLAPGSANLAASASQSFTATVSGSTNTNVVWSVDGVVQGNASVGTISGTGSTITYTAPSTGGSHTLVACSGADSTKSASATLTVQNAQTSCAPAPTSALVASVKSYGAVGNAVADDTAAIQRAVNAVAGTGGTVLVPSGVYMINALATSPGYGIRLGSNMTLRLEAGAVLKAIPNASQMYIIVLASGITNVNIVGSGTIEGDLATHMGTGGEGGYCVQISNGSSYIAIEGITTKEGWGDGFYVDGADHVTFCNVTADHNRRQGISIVDGDQILVKNSTLKRTTGFMSSGIFWSGFGLDNEPNPGQTVSHVTITGCTITGNAGGGISSGVPSANAGVAFTHDIVIDGNVISNNGSATQAHPAIEIAGTTRDQWIANNIIDGNTSMGIYVRTGPTGIRIQNNTVSNTHGAPSAPIYVDRAGYGILLSDVGGNTVTGNTGSGNAGCGIFELRPTSTNTISGNSVSGNGTCP